MKDEINILFTSCGRRVELIKKFQEMYFCNNIKGKIHCGDLSDIAPAYHISKYRVLLPPIMNNDYIPFILKYSIENNINIIIPLLDTELPKLSAAKQEFSNNGVSIFISDENIIEYGKNKVLTDIFFRQSNVLTPQIYSSIEHISDFPIILKPKMGSASKGVFIINSEKDLHYHYGQNKDILLQECIIGDEYTIDVWYGFTGKPRCIIPRKRIEVRSGEVSKGITIFDESIINDIMKIDYANSGFVGCITYQCIKNKAGNNYFIEMNPRFGGGVPLSIAAGANFPYAIILEYQKKTIPDDIFKWTRNYMMLRYDQGVYIKR